MSSLNILVCLIRNLLDSQQELDSGSEDEFAPSKKELQSSSEEEEEEEDTEGLDSDEEVVSKRGRHSASGSRTPRSNRRLSTRTPRKTPNSKVKDLNV